MTDLNEIQVSANEIVPGLWLGNQAASQNKKFLIYNNINAIVNCTKHIPNTFPELVEYIQLPINDPGPTNELVEDHVIMLKNLTPIMKFISKFMDSGRSVLVHCHAGMQRSATIVLIYLMYTSKLRGPSTKKDIKTEKYNAALNHILSKRPIVYAFGNCNNFKPVFNFLK